MQQRAEGGREVYRRWFIAAGILGSQTLQHLAGRETTRGSPVLSQVFPARGGPCPHAPLTREALILSGKTALPPAPSSCNRIGSRKSLQMPPAPLPRKVLGHRGRKNTPPEGRKIRSRRWSGVIRDRLRRWSRYLRGEKLSLVHGERSHQGPGERWGGTRHRVPSAPGRSKSGRCRGSPLRNPPQHPPKPAPEGRRGCARPPPLPAGVPGSNPTTRGWGEAAGG